VSLEVLSTRSLWRADRFHLLYGRGQVVSPEGDVLWEDPDWMPNALVDIGEKEMIDVFLREQAHKNKYLALLNQGDPAETDNQGNLTETKTPGSNGYARQQIVAGDWGAATLDSGDYMSTAAEKTFGPASGASWTVTHAILCTHVTSQADPTSLFLLFVALSSSTTVGVGQNFKYTLKYKLQ